VLAPFAAYALLYFTIIPTNYHGGPNPAWPRSGASAAPLRFMYV
jgi:hypothetical protein